MSLLTRLSEIWADTDYPFFIHEDKGIKFTDVLMQENIDISVIRPGDVVAIIGDFNLPSILMLLRLIDLKVIVVPLTVDTKNHHEYFFEAAKVNFVIEGNLISQRNYAGHNDLIQILRTSNHAGLVLFSTGTTGRPKAILHDLTLFLKRFEEHRPAFTTINFLLFDHIGGINTLFHTLFNKGVVVAPKSRSIESILHECNKYSVEVLPTTPTFLRMMLLSGLIPKRIPESLKIITYGTERMDQTTLDQLCDLLPSVDFRQTFGMSELGILRVKSRSRDSLFMKIGGEGVETKVVEGVLYIKSQTPMLGYLNAPSPFDEDGWYATNDIVEVEDIFYKVTGRLGEVINVGGLKFMASYIESVVLNYPGIALVKVCAKNNPITGQHVELTVQSTIDHVLDKEDLLCYLKNNLQEHMIPRRIVVSKVNVGHRFKKL